MKADLLGRESSLPGKRPDMVEVQLLLGQVHLDQGDFPRAFQMFAIAARSGRPRALNMLGRAYERGWGVVRNIPRALDYFTAASQGGDGWADFNLGDLYLAGDGVPRDAGRAYGHYLRASRHGVAKALNMLGLLHEQGTPHGPDPDGARQFFQAAAEAGDCWACLNMGRLCLERDAPQDAARWFERSLPLGFPQYWQALETVLADVEGEDFRPIRAEARRRRICIDNIPASS
ncbi:tetratricopeptide repeat protein [Gluconacetobacter takamatsuzukensis]|uniref:Sel1 repeat family protein n=1 Tax=Gluconacetobacter takamatsuzukensis TaxID=1286190 RepID=A0A7W4KF95_9PROT|nr:tetratricopeptide repeat protein [Gluconacetobacter takamatsuzukensis]MBB2205846.1 sel1 repeat family protein [Gluconacetobacter takamatsuzukensis]